MKRVFIIHGWGAEPDEPILVWLEKQLAPTGAQVVRPTMPNSDEPDIQAWVSHLAGIVGLPDEETFFVGHSIGCQTIIRYLETVNTPVGGAVFIAGWFTLKPDALDNDDDRAIAKPWLETPIDFAKVRRMLKNVFAIFSDDDAYVPVENAQTFAEELGARTKIEHNRGHFSAEEDGITKIPEVVPELLKMIR